MAAGGIWLLTDDGGNRPVQAETNVSPTATPSATATATATRTATPSPSATASPTATPSPSPTTRAAASSGSGTGGGGAADEPVPTATPEPAAPVAAAGGDYCPSSDNSFPPSSVFGLFRIGGVDVPAGATVSLAFDGVIGPSRTTTDAGGYRVDFNAAPENCANRVGASISVVYNGVSYATGLTVGGGPALRADVVN